MVHIESNNIPENIKSSFQGKYEIFSLNNKLMNCYSINIYLNHDLVGELS